MKVFNCRINKIGIAVSVAAAMFLSACGGGGYESKNDNYTGADLKRAVNGVAVDGLVKNATVTIYKIDFSRPDWKGERLDEGRTNENGRFEDVFLDIGQFEQAAYLVEVTDMPVSEPLQQMSSIVSKSAIIDVEIPVYVTPMSTLFTEFLKEKYSGVDGVQSIMTESSSKLFSADQVVIKNRFGLGVVADDTDLFLSPVIYDRSFTADENSDDNISDLNRAKGALGLRTANNVLLNSLNEIKTAFNLNASLNEILADVAKDQVDGKPDLLANGVPLSGALAGLNAQDVTLNGDLVKYVRAIYKSKTEAQNSQILGLSGKNMTDLAQVMLDELNANNVDGVSGALIPPATSLPTFKGQFPGDLNGKCVVGTSKLEFTNSAGAEASACPNALPVVNSPVLLLGQENAPVKVDFSASSDPDGESLTVKDWIVVSKPASANASFSNFTGTPLAKNSIAEFTADTAGNYVIKATVTDGKEDVISDSVSVTIRAASAVNNPPEITSITPVANLTNLSAEKQVLSAAYSDIDGDTVVPSWECQFKRFNYLPPAPTLVRNANSANAEVLIQPFEGKYMCTLTVTDGLATSAAKTVEFEVDKPAAPAGLYFGASLGLLGLLLFRKRMK